MTKITKYEDLKCVRVDANFFPVVFSDYFFCFLSNIKCRKILSQEAVQLNSAALRYCLPRFAKGL